MLVAKALGRRASCCRVESDSARVRWSWKAELPAYDSRQAGSDLLCDAERPRPRLSARATSRAVSHRPHDSHARGGGVELATLHAAVTNRRCSRSAPERLPESSSSGVSTVRNASSAFSRASSRVRWSGRGLTFSLIWQSHQLSRSGSAASHRPTRLDRTSDERLDGIAGRSCIRRETGAWRANAGAEGRRQWPRDSVAKRGVT
jgi:hypothetical protein